MSTPYEQVRCGEIFQFDGLADRGELHRAFLHAFHRAIAAICGRSSALAVRTRGLERLHDYASPEQLLRISQRLRADRQVIGLTDRLMRHVAFDLLQTPDNRWAVMVFLVLIHPPHTYLSAFAPELDGRDSDITPLATHVDSPWDRDYENINAWFSLTRTRLENGVILYKDGFDRTWYMDGPFHLVSGQKIPKPRRYAVPPGGLLVYSGKHLHASQLNATDETRVSIVKWFIVDKPRRKPGLIVSRLNLYRVSRSWRSSLQFKVQSALWHLRGRLVERPTSYANTVRGSTPADRPTNQRTQGSGWARIGHLNQYRDAEATSVKVGDRSLAVFRRGEQIDALDAFCPHAGGPLADGYFEGTRVTCPFHGLEFDVRSGECTNYCALRTRSYPTRVNNGELEVLL